MTFPPFVAFPPSWVCRTCLRRPIFSRLARPQTALRRTYSGLKDAAPKQKPRRGRRILLVSVTATTVFAAAVVASDEGRHFASAAQRTARVVSTLALCAMECVTTIH
jgi:aarF domain-containing kinase